MAAINVVTDCVPNSVVTAYTCPGGISHAVVHLYLVSRGNIPVYAKLNNTAANNVGIVLQAQVDTPTTTSVPVQASASITLVPGNTVGILGNTSAVGTLTVTGFEVA